MADRRRHFSGTDAAIDPKRKQAGFEQTIGGQWTAKLEYLYVDLGTVDGSLVGLGVCAAGRQFARHQQYRRVNCRFSGQRSGEADRGQVVSARAQCR
jgi:hypothetical protein